MKVFERSRFIILFAICSSLSFSCSQDSDQLAEINTSELPQLDLELQFSISDPEDVFLQQIGDVKSDSEGRIFLLDQRALQIHVFDSSGKYMTSIGREGSGPGEFRSLIKMYIDQNEQLFAFDVREARNTIFAENNTNWELKDIFSIDGQRYGIESADSEGNVILRQSPPQTPEPGAYWYEHELATGNLSSGLTKQNVLKIKEMGNLVLDSGFMIGIPFGWTTVLNTDPHGNIYLVWNEQFELAKYNAQLEFIDSLSVNIPNQPISSETRNEAIDRLNDNFKALGRKHVPDNRPVISNMFIDANENLWLQTFDSPEYLVLDREGSPLKSFDLVDELRLVHVDENRLYASKVGVGGYQLHVFDYQL
ncbi:MAG: 6-bladed beta-propeller [Balneolaceae bacterium]